MKKTSVSGFNSAFLAVLFLSVSVNCHIMAQYIDDSRLNELKSDFEIAYGLDENLINGFRYRDKYPDAEGHPFWGDNQFFEGAIVINDKEYNNVFLKYDIAGQNIILQYRNSVNGIEQIQLNNYDIKEFEIRGKLFRKLQFPETGERFLRNNLPLISNSFIS